MIGKNKVIVALLVLVLLISLEGCGQKPTTTDTGTANKSDGNGAAKAFQSPDGSVWPKWKSEALQLAFNYPPSARITVTPQDTSKVNVYFSSNVSVGINIVEAKQTNETDFMAEKKRMFTTGYRDSTNNFLEYTSNYNKVSGYPAAYIEYRWNVMKTDMRTISQSVLKGKYEITVFSVYKLADDSLYLNTARGIIGSLEILNGEVNLSSLAGEKGVEPTKPTGGQTTGSATTGTQPTDGVTSGGNFKPFTKYPIALSTQTCTETGVQKTIGAAFGQSANLADWNFLKSAYGEMLPAVLADLGLKNEGAAWVSLNGNEYISNNRHFFIQRFDSGKPASFAAHDQIGTIYLGSWYGIDIPVLAKSPN